MLRTEIDWDRANLLQLTHAYRDALKLVLTGKVVRQFNFKDGAFSLPIITDRQLTVRPTLMELLHQVCVELDLDAEHAG